MPEEDKRDYTRLQPADLLSGKVRVDVRIQEYVKKDFEEMAVDMNSTFAVEVRMALIKHLGGYQKAKKSKLSK